MWRVARPRRRLDLGLLRMGIGACGQLRHSGRPSGVADHCSLILAALASSRHCGSSRAIRAREFGRRAADRLDAVALQTLDHVGRAGSLRARRRELVDDRLRRAGRRHDGDPQDALVARQAHLGDGRRVGHQLGAMPAGDAEHAELAGDDLRIGGRVGVELELHDAGEQVGHRRRRAAIGNVRDLDAGAPQQQFHGDVRQRADAGRGIVQLAGILLRVVDELGKRRERPRRDGSPAPPAPRPRPRPARGPSRCRRASDGCSAALMVWFGVVSSSV